MRFLKLALPFVVLSSLANSSYADTQLANYLGTGSNPRLQLELSDSGSKQPPLTIDYQHIGDIPWSMSSSLDWSTWNVKDTEGHCYGTITLHSNGTQSTFGDYTGGQGYLEGIHFSYNQSVKAFQLTADKICPPQGQGPFPNAPIATPAVYPGTTTPINLSVKGSTIVNDSGKPILLKGLVRPSLEWNPQGQFLSESDIKNMKAWGINAVRLDLYQDYWFASAPLTEKGSYKQVIDAIIYYAIKNNMAVILDLHWVEEGHQSPMANKKSLNFWKQVAGQYKNFGTVIFELYNEPYGISQQVWLKGDDTYVGYQSLYDTVRSAGAKNICIVNGLDWGYDLSFVNDNFHVNGENIVYGSHPYNDKGEGGTSFMPDFSGVLGKYPLIFTEFGVNQDSYFPSGYERIYGNILAYANKNHVNYTGFAWWVDKDSFPVLVSDWSGTPRNGGVLVHNDLIQAPPTPLY